MKFKNLLATITLLLSLNTYASVRPGTSIAASIKAANRSEVQSDLSSLGIDSARADAVLTAVNKGILTADQFSTLLTIEDAGKADLVKTYISDLLPAALNAESNNADAAALLSMSGEGSSAQKRVDEIKKIGELLVTSKSDGTLNVENLPQIMAVLKDLAEGKISEIEANLKLTSEKLVNVEEGQDALDALRKCTT